jgi:hypothetical protein
VARRLLLLLDGILLVVAVFLGVRLYEAWGARPVTVPAETPPAASVVAPASPATAPAPPPLTAYTVVAERNLFSPTRTETAPEPPRTAAGTVAPAPPAPKPRLYGIVLLPEGRGRAYLEDVQRRRVFGYSVGDVVGDARLEQIKSDRVVLRRGGETFEVMLYDPSKPRVQSPEAGGVGRPGVGRPPGSAPAPVSPGSVPSPVPGLRGPVRPRVAVPTAPPPSAESQEQPTEEE